MPDLMTMLPFLNGWKYVFSGSPFTISNPQEVWSDEITQAWLILANFQADDAYATISVTFPPKDFTLSGSIAQFYAAGITVPYQIGFYVPLYNQPTPTTSTKGNYLLNFSTYPLALPPNSRFRVQLSLGEDSTQSSSDMEVDLTYVKVTDEEAFLTSLKEKFGIS